MKVIKVEALAQFTLERFDEIRNLVRNQKDINHNDKTLYYGDTFECDKEMADYLTGNNPLKKTVVKVIEVIPTVEEPTSAKNAPVEEKATKKVTKKSAAKKK